MFKLLICMALVAAVYCVPLNDPEQQNAKADTGVAEEQPQADFTGFVESVQVELCDEQGLNCHMVDGMGVASPDNGHAEGNVTSVVEVKLCTDNIDNCQTVPAEGDIENGFKTKAYQPNTNQPNSKDDIMGELGNMYESMSQMMKELESALLTQMQQEIQSRGSKGYSAPAQYEARPYGGGQGQANQLPPRPTYSKGQQRSGALLREVAEPTAQCQGEKDDLKMAQMNNDIMRQARESARQEAAKANSALTSLRRNYNNLYAQKSEIKQTSQNLERQNEQMMAENTMLRAEKSNLEKQVETNLAEITNLNSQVNNLQAENANLIQGLDQCHANVADLETEVAQKTQEIANLNAQVEQLNAEIQSLNERIAELESQVATLQEENAELKAELAQTREELENCNREVDNLRNNIEQLNAEITNLNTEIGRQNEQVRKLTNENKELVEMNFDLQNRALQCEARPCPDGYSLYGNKCYKYVDQKMQWKSAQEYCMSEKANLASITSKLQQDNIVQYLRSERHVSDHYVYIGGEELRGQWQWVDTGSGFGYTNWYHGQPAEPKVGMKDRCLSLYMLNPKKVGKWLEMPCDLDFGFVCQQPSKDALEHMEKALFAEAAHLLNVEMEAMGIMSQNGEHRKSIYVMMGDKEQN